MPIVLLVYIPSLPENVHRSLASLMLMVTFFLCIQLLMHMYSTYAEASTVAYCTTTYKHKL